MRQLSCLAAAVSAAVFSLFASQATAQLSNETYLYPDPIDIFGDYGLRVEMSDDWAFVSSREYLYFYRNSVTGWFLYDLQTLPYPYPINASIGSMGEFSFDGRTLAVGLEFHGTFPGANTGAVAMYQFDGTDWSLTQTIIPSDIGLTSQFGDYVELDDASGVMAVTCENCVVNGSNNGNRKIVFVYRRINSVWQEEQRIEFNSISDFAFGWSLAVENNVLAIGFRGDQSRFPDKRGSVRVYQAAASGAPTGYTWTETQTLTAPTPFLLEQGENLNDEDDFGWAVSLEGGLLAVGAPGDQTAPASLGAVGAVYLYQWNTSSFSYTQRVLPPDYVANVDGRFGTSVAIDGDELAISADWVDSFYGSGYVVDLTSTPPLTAIKYQPSLGSTGSEYGSGPHGVAIDAGNIILSSNVNQVVIIDTN